MRVTRRIPIEGQKHEKDAVQLIYGILKVVMVKRTQPKRKQLHRERKQSAEDKPEDE